MKRTLQSSDAFDSMTIANYLLSVGENLCGQKQDVLQRLSQEVAFVTHQKVSFLFHNVRERQQRPKTYGLNVPVRFGNVLYGTLVAHIQNETAQDAFSPSLVQMMASLCGSILYTCELSWFVLESSQKSVQHDYSAVTRATFTRRQWDVLQLICRGHTKEQIAQLLSIAPATLQKHRQAIYNHLHVNNEYEVPLVAYQIGLYSPLQCLSVS